MALTATSYQGTWDVRHAGSEVNATNGTTLSLYADGSTACTDKATGKSTSCKLTITDPSAGAFSYSDATGTATGRFDYLTGTVTGSYADTTATPATGSITGGRR